MPLTELFRPSPHPALTVRPAGLADAPALARLSAQFGYSCTTSDVERRLRTVLEDPNQFVVAALWGDEIVGWTHGYACCLLESEPYVEIGGLVVDQSYRRKGVATRLLDRLEEWARSKGMARLSVRSNITRPEAREFYQAQGYKQVKTQWVFRKQV